MPKTQSTEKKPKRATGSRVAAARVSPKRAPVSRISFQEVMTALEKAGSAQTRKTYLRHGAPEPMFGVSFATLKTLYKRIKIDQELAEALWETGNFDARNLAVKIVDPAAISAKELDRWAGSATAPMCGAYVGHLAAESPHGQSKAEEWLASRDVTTRSAGWCAVAALAMIDESMEDSWFAARLSDIEKGLNSAPNANRYHMNQALIAIGGRNAGLRKLALAAAKRIGKVDVDHGDTDCKTPDATEYIEKNWARAKAGGFDSPAAHERSRESMRTRC